MWLLQPRDREVVSQSEDRTIGVDAFQILELMPAAVVVFDVNGKVQFTNQRFLQLMAAMGLKACRLQKFGLPEWVRLDKRWSPIAKTLVNGCEWRHPAIDFDINGRKQYFDITALPVTINNTVTAVIVIAWPLMDIWHPQGLASEWERLATSVRLSADAAHEIRNALTVIRGFIQLTQLKDESNSRYMQAVIEEIDRLDVLLQGLLSVSRPIIVQRQPSDLNRLIREVIVLIEVRARRHGIKIETDLDPSLPITELDAGQMRQALFNLAINAIEAMRSDGGKLLWHTKYLPHESCVEIKVQDTGPGIAEEHLHQVLTPFFTTKPEGTGLGLPLVNNIVQNHGGTFSLESQVGHGTIATIRLPLQVSSESKE